MVRQDTQIRVLPLPKVHGEWAHDDSKYPETIKVPMSDGRVVTYRIDIEQPHPSFVDAMDSLERMFEIAGLIPGRTKK